MMFGLWFSLKVHGLQIGAPPKKWVSATEMKRVGGGSNVFRLKIAYQKRGFLWALGG